MIYCEGGGALKQVAQGSCGCHIPGDVQDQVGRDSEQSGLGEVSAHGRELALHDLQGPVPTPTIL